MKATLLVLACLLSYSCFSQEFLAVDKTEIKIGDQVRATIRINLSEGREWVNVETIWPDSLKAIEVVKGPEWNKENLNSVLATWTIAFFDTGWVRIPSLLVVIKQGGQLDTTYTNDIPVKVLTVEPDSNGLETIKDIYAQPFSPGYYKRYLPHITVFLLILAGLFLWMRQHKYKKVIPEFIPPPPSPQDWALKALDELSERKLWQRGEVKEHYSSLTAILREYLERRYGIHAMEQTTDVILIQLSHQHLNEMLMKDTAELLSVADLIKFAKADPGTDIHSATIERVRSFVRETTPAFHQEPMDHFKSTEDEVVE